MSRAIFRGLALMAAAMTAVLVAGPSSGAFSGRNGLIAFDTHRDGDGEVYVMNADGSDQRDISNNHAAEDATPKWSPDGRRIVFRSNRDGNLEIYVMNADGSDQTRLTSNSVRDDLPGWTADGRIVFSRFSNGDWDVWIMNSDGSGQQDLTNSSSTDFFGFASPRGDKIAFASDRGGGNFAIYTMNLNGSQARRVTDPPAGFDDFWPNWAPHGNDLAFLRGDAIDNDVYVVHADGTALRQVTNTPARVEFGPAWSPAGDKIAYQGCTDFGLPGMICEIYAHDSAGSGETQLTTVGGGAPDWQPLARGGT